ncbi:MAG: hypothetical protein U0Q14_14240 [Dermatophilaceae bacterium]
MTTPTVIHLNKGGTRGSQSSCSCQPPDTNAAISATRIEAVNLSLTIYKRGGALISRTSLASWWPTTRSISDPHILYDNAAKRWILVFIPVPDIDDDDADDVRCRLDLGRPGEHLAPLHRDLQRRALPRRDAPSTTRWSGRTATPSSSARTTSSWAWVVSAISTAPSSPSRRAPRMAAWVLLPGLRHRLQHLPGDPQG